MDTFEKLEKKITKAVALIDKLAAENHDVIEKNKQLDGELADLREKLEELEIKEKEISEAVKEKVGNILKRLEILEQS
jgi:FtsZ-binding cell division protein ZapB